MESPTLRFKTFNAVYGTCTKLWPRVSRMADGSAPRDHLFITADRALVASGAKYVGE